MFRFRFDGERGWLRTAALALVCVLLTELVACLIFAPELAGRVIEPVRLMARRGLERGASLLMTRREAVAVFSAEFGGAAVDFLKDAWEESQRRIEELFSAPPEVAVQEADEPKVADTRPTEDPAVTRFRKVGDRELLTGGIVDLTYFHQKEEPWGEQRYGYDDIGRYGCGPTVMAMAVASLTDHPADPAQMAEWAFENGQWASRSGSNHTIVEAAAEAFGLSAAPLEERTGEDIVAALLEGKLLVALMGPGHFTSGGHFILLRGVTLSGQVLVADSNSRERSLTEWDPDVIAEELSAARSGGAPLWEIVRAAE